MQSCRRLELCRKTDAGQPRIEAINNQTRQHSNMNSSAITSFGMRFSHGLSRNRTTEIVLVYAALAALLAVPMMTTEVPLGVDDLNHLARIYVRAHIGSDPDLARLYRVRTDIIPYLGMDLLLTPLARALPIMLVGRIYILALVWGLVGAVAVLRRSFTSSIGLAPAAAGLIAYNGLIAWGLINYVLGIILALLLFAAWHTQRSRPWLIRFVLFTGGATVLYLTHLLAFALYGVLVVSYEIFGLAQPWRRPLRDWVVLAGQAVPGLLLWTFLNNRMLGANFGIIYSAVGKLFALESPFLFRDAMTGSRIGIVVALLWVIPPYLTFRGGWLALPRILAAPALVLLALTIILPIGVFGIAFIDYRFAVPAACLTLAGLRFKVPTWARAVIPVAMAVLTVMHVADVSALMHNCNGQYAELRTALAALPRGAELTTVLEQTEPIPGVACAAMPIYAHMPQLVTIDRSGYAPDFFAKVTSVNVRRGRPTDSDPVPAESFATAPSTGYVLWIHLGQRRPPPPGLLLLRRGTFFDLFAVTGKV